MTQVLYVGGYLMRLWLMFAAMVDNITAKDKDEIDDLRNINLRAEKVLDRYGNNILRLAYSYLRNMSDAEDILQETLIRFLQKAPNFENDFHEKAWLLKVAANLSKNRISYNKRRDYAELNDEIAADDKNDDFAFVWEAVKQLPPTQSEVIHLFYHEGYSSSEIADMLSRNEATVRSDLKRGRERLKLILKEAYDFE